VAAIVGRTSGRTEDSSARCAGAGWILETGIEEAAVMRAEIGDWWPCPECGNNDQATVQWSDIDTVEQVSEDLPLGALRRQWETTGLCTCSACGFTDRRTIACGASL
jgi:hypothetical protein